MANYFIVGGSSGIGLSLVQKLAGEGHLVYTTYHTHEMESENQLVEYHQLNVLQDNDSFNFLPEVLNGIIYCPGSINLKPFERIKAQDFINDYNLQVIGAIKIIQAVLPRLKKAMNASITLFSTVAVQNGLAYHSQVAASKGAIEGLTRALAAEYAPSIRVNCIAPSLTDTPLAAGLLNTDVKREVNAQRHPLKKIGTPDDIASMAAYLISDKAGWITGQIFHVDGGMGTLK